MMALEFKQRGVGSRKKKKSGQICFQDRGKCRPGRRKYQFPRELKVAGEGFLGVGTCSEEKPEVEELSPDLDFLTDRHLRPASELRFSP